jgi:hypothetical protein
MIGDHHEAPPPSTIIIESNERLDCLFIHPPRAQNYIIFEPDMKLYLSSISIVAKKLNAVAWIERRPSKEQYELTRPPDEQQQLSLTERVITTLLLVLFFCAYYQTQHTTGGQIGFLSCKSGALELYYSDCRNCTSMNSYVLRFGAKKICPPPKMGLQVCGSKEVRILL